MNKQRVAAVLCASMVLTASPVNGLALTVEASENEAENNTESSGETKENENRGTGSNRKSSFSRKKIKKKYRLQTKKGNRQSGRKRRKFSKTGKKTLILVGMLQKKQTLQNQPGMLQKISSL